METYFFHFFGYGFAFVLWYYTLRLRSVLLFSAIAPCNGAFFEKKNTAQPSFFLNNSPPRRGGIFWKTLRTLLTLIFLLTFLLSWHFSLTLFFLLTLLFEAKKKEQHPWNFTDAVYVKSYTVGEPLRQELGVLQHEHNFYQQAQCWNHNAGYGQFPCVIPTESQDGCYKPQREKQEAGSQEAQNRRTET